MLVALLQLNDVELMGRAIRTMDIIDSKEAARQTVQVMEVFQDERLVLGVLQKAPSTHDNCGYYFSLDS